MFFRPVSTGKKVPTYHWEDEMEINIHGTNELIT